MRVFDWDKTIYDGDSSFGFICYLLWKRPKTWIKIPCILVFGLGYGLGLVKKQVFKEQLFSMFQFVSDMPSITKEFCEHHLNHVKSFYQVETGDVIISASPEFLVKEFAQLLGIQEVMGSPVDIHTGKYSGLNCHGEEKVRRFYEKYPEGTISEFYSDSLSDAPLANLSRQAYLVKKNTLVEWPK